MRAFGRTGMHLSVLGFGCGAVGGLMVRGESGRPGAHNRECARCRSQLLRYSGPVWQRRIGKKPRPRPTYLKVTNVVVGTKVRLPNAELGRIADAVATSLEGSLGATALRSGWHPFICTRDHRHGRRGYALGCRPRVRVAAAGGYDSLFIARFLPFRDLTSAAVHCRYSRRVHEGWCNGNYYSPTSD